MITHIMFLVLLINALASAILCGFGYQVKNNVENADIYLKCTEILLTTCIGIGLFSQIILAFDNKKDEKEGRDKDE